MGCLVQFGLGIGFFLFHFGFFLDLVFAFGLGSDFFRRLFAIRTWFRFGFFLLQWLFAIFTHGRLDWTIIEDFLGGFSTRRGFGHTWCTAADRAAGMGQLPDQLEINLAFFQVDSGHLDFDFIAQAKGLTA